MKRISLLYLFFFSITLNAQNSPKITIKQGDSIRVVTAKSDEPVRLHISTLQAKDAPKVSLKQGDGIRITAADSSAHMRLRVWFQPIYTVSKSLTDNSKWTSNAGVQRARLNFTGWIYSPKLRYHFQPVLAAPELRSGLDATAQQEGFTGKVLLDAALQWKFHPNFELWVGQERTRGSYEGFLPGFAMQLVNKSQFNSMFNYNRDIGIQLLGSYGKKFIIRPQLRWTLGNGHNIVTNNSGGFQYMARLEVQPFGKFNEVFNTDFKREPSPKLAIGATFDFNHNAARQRGNAGRFLTDNEGNLLNSSLFTFLVDAVFKYKGFSANSAFAMRSATHGDLGFHEATGLYLQGGYLLKNNYEFAFRYSMVEPIGAKTASGSREYLVGISKYINGHPLKVQSDIGLIRNTTTQITTLQYRFQIVAGF